MTGEHDWAGSCLLNLALPAVADADAVAVHETVVEDAVTEHPAVTKELTGVQVVEAVPVTHDTQMSVTVLVAHDELVADATLVVSAMLQPVRVPHVDMVLVAVVILPETPHVDVIPHKVAVCSWHSLSGSSGYSGGPLGGIVI